LTLSKISTCFIDYNPEETVNLNCFENAVKS